MHAMGYDRRDGSGCAYVLVVPLLVALVAGGDGQWIIAAVGAAAAILVAVVTIAELWPIRRRR